MASSLSENDPLPRGTPIPPRRPVRGRRPHRRPAGLRWLLAAVIVALVAVGAEFVYHAVRSDPRDARAITERELRVNTLQPGEKVIAATSAFQRPAVDYYRATRGLMVLTDRRLLFLGLEPRDLLAPPDEPPTFTERDFAIDTLVQLRAGRTFFELAKAIVITAPRAQTAIGVPTPAWPDAQRLLDSVAVRHKALYAIGLREQAARQRAATNRRAAEEEARKARYYTVQRGDALASIAAQWNLTPEQLRAMNHLPDNKIKIGQSLLVRAGRAGP